MIYKNILIGIFLLTLSPLLYTMKEDITENEHENPLTPDGPYLIGFTDNQGQFIPCVNEEKDQYHLFDTFFYSLEKTKSDHDTQNLVRMKKAVFIQLFVQASKNTTLDPQPRQELLKKIKNNSIDMDTESEKLYITEKDNNHRLLSYIPKKNIKYPAIGLVNGKEVEISHLVGSFQTEEDKIRTKEEFKRIAAYKEQHKGEKMPQGCFTGYYSGEEIKIKDCNFEDNLEHHEHVVQQFNELTK